MGLILVSGVTCVVSEPKISLINPKRKMIPKRMSSFVNLLFITSPFLNLIYLSGTLFGCYFIFAGGVAHFIASASSTLPAAVGSVTPKL
jgi:hypothetical protein